MIEITKGTWSAIFNYWITFSLCHFIKIIKESEGEAMLLDVKNVKKTFGRG